MITPESFVMTVWHVLCYMSLKVHLEGKGKREEQGGKIDILSFIRPDVVSRGLLTSPVQSEEE